MATEPSYLSRPGSDKPDLVVVRGVKDAAKLVGLAGTGIRERHKADLYFPGSLDWKGKRFRWYRVQLERWAEHRRARLAYRTSIKNRIRTTAVRGGCAASGHWEGLKRSGRQGNAGLGDWLYESYDGVYQLDYVPYPGPPTYSLLGTWGISCNEIVVAEGAPGFSYAREVLSDLREQDRRHSGAPCFNDLGTLPIELGDDTDDAARPGWADSVAGPVVGEGLRLAPELPEIPNTWGVVLNTAIGEIDAVPMRSHLGRPQREAKRAIAVISMQDAQNEQFRRYLEDVCADARRRPRTALQHIRGSVGEELPFPEL